MNTIDEQAKVTTLILFGESENLRVQEDWMLWLTQKVKDLLDKDFNALVNLLYRIDVNEKKAKTCFGKSNEEIAKCLSKLIWERQLEKAESRANYRKNGD
jgi:hypothetical protein